MPELTLLHVVGGEHIGYGRYGVQLAAELRKSGTTVYDSIVDAPGTPSLAGQALEVWGERSPGLTNVICWASVPTHARGWYEGQVPIILTMWEATELPPSFRENLHEFDTVIVPSTHNLELFSRYHDNVKYVPLGVDPEVWSYRARPALGNRFVFLIGGSGPRKGTDLAVKAFKAAFPEGSFDGPVPYLVMKNPKGEDFYGPRIEMIPGRLSAQAEVELYASAHCYVQPSRGEGFGLQPLQAIAQGCPTILTDAHGHEAFAHLGMGLSSKEVPAGYFIYGDSGNWWEPDFDELVDTMRWTYNNYDEAKARATESSLSARKVFTWENTARHFLDAIGPERCGPYAGSGEWYKPTAKLYLTITNCDHRADIGGTFYYFQKGEERYEPADVKRILFESEKLDPRCLRGDDLGLHPSQVAKIPDYEAKHSYCPTCHQKYGSGITKADELMA